MQTQLRVVWLYQDPLSLRRTGQTYFDLLQFHLDPTNLLVQLSLGSFLVLVLFVAVFIEHISIVFGQLSLPPIDLVRMAPVFSLIVC